MVKLDDLGNLLEALLELLNLLEVVAQLDDGCRLEHPVLVDDELAVREGVDVTLDQKEIGAALHGQESLAGNIDTMSILEVLDGSASSGFKLME